MIHCHSLSWVISEGDFYDFEVHMWDVHWSRVFVCSTYIKSASARDIRGIIYGKFQDITVL